MKISSSAGTKRIRPCPLCGSKESIQLFVQKFTGGMDHTIVSCKLCGFVYVNNSPDQKFYNKYYRHMSKYEIERSHGYHRKYAQIIQKYVSKDANILDIGSSTGHVLSLLKKAGYTSLLGIDPSPTCKQIGKERYNITIETTDIDHFKPNKKFDCILFTAVLEHVDNPRKVIATIKELLADGGYLLIVVPDAGKFYKDFDEPYGEFSTEHISFFSETYLYHFLPKFTNVYMKSDDICLYSLWKKESDVTEAIIKYIAESEKKMVQVNKNINALPEKVIVWGAGALTRRILETTELHSKATLFVDKNVGMQGTSLRGIPIVGPEELPKYSEPIFISSYVFQEEIKKEIKKIGLKNHVFTL